MKLIHCHIENFGKLSNYTYDFAQGVNRIYLENGMGKSTFAAFLRVMFFGFQGETKRGTHAEFENERRFFEPWQKGVYGGQITFSVGQKKYLLSRVFGKNANSDTFRLQDADTLLDSSDYTEKIGEELFEIDSDAFMRTVFVGQEACAECTVSDSISAKLGNLVQNTDDINNYEAVSKRLAEALNHMTAKRASGKLNKIKKEISDLQTQVRMKDVLEETMTVLSQRRDDAKQKKEWLLLEQKRVEEMLEQASRVEEKRAKKEQHDILKQDYEEKKRELANAKSYFPGDLPEQQTIHDLQEDVSWLAEIEKKQNSAGLSESEQAKLSAYDEKYANGFPDMEEIVEKQEQWITRNNLNNTLKMKQSNVETQQKKEKEEYAGQVSKQRKVSFLFLIVSVIILIAGLISPASGTIKIVCICCAIACFVFGIRGLGKKAPYMKSSILADMCQDVESDLKMIHQCEDDMQMFFSAYKLDYKEDRISMSLQRLKDDVWEYNNLSAKKSEKLSDEEIIMQKQKRERLIDFVQSYVKKEAQSMSYLTYMSLLKDMEQHLLLYSKRVEECNASKAKISAWEEKNAPEEYSLEDTDGEALEKPAYYREALANLRREYEDSLHSISEYRKQLDEKTEDYDLILEKEDKIKLLEEEKLLIAEKYDIIEKTQCFLAKAKENFTAKYTKPLMDGFSRYFQMLCTDTTDSYKMDANLRIEKMEQGMLRDVRHLSRGYRDLIGLCMRLAIVDAMYDSKHPFLVLDDPFVNLDNKKIDGAKAFLDELSKTYQVIYFTCHESRV